MTTQTVTGHPLAAAHFEPWRTGLPSYLVCVCGWQAAVVPDGSLFGWGDPDQLLIDAYAAHRREVRAPQTSLRESQRTGQGWRTERGPLLGGLG